MGKRHSVNMDELKNQAQEDKAQISGGGKLRDKMFKFKAGKNKILILPPYKKGGLYKRVVSYAIWKNKRPIIQVGSPKIKDGEIDKVMEYGFKLKEKYETHKSKKLQQVWRLFMPVTDVYVNAIDMKNPDQGVRVMKLPMVAYKLLLSEIEECDSADDICDLDKGYPMIVEAQGEGKKRKYEVAKFSKKPANLVANELVDEDEILDNLPNLDKLQPKVSDDKLEKLFSKLKSRALEIIEHEGESYKDDDNDDEIEDGDDDDEIEDDDDDDESDDDDDEDDSDDDDDEDDDEESEEDDDEDDEETEDDDDEDDDDDEIDDDDDDEDDETEKKKKSKKKIVKKSKKKIVKKPKRKGKGKKKSKKKK